MIIINSAAYVSPEFQAEIGSVIPCMLPIGNKKILELQVKVLRERFPKEKIIVSIPENYALTINEASVIKELGVDVQAVPEDFTLAEAILYILNSEIDKPFEHIRVLHGDTYIVDIPTDTDTIAIISRHREYNWHDEYLDNGEAVIWCGYFSFSSRLALIKALALAKGDFIKAIYRYRSDRPMILQPVQQWYDCGHINTFFEARASITTQRSFNALTIRSGVVTKSSDDNTKIAAEIHWFNTIPPSLKRFIPQFIDSGTLDDTKTLYYRLEYLPLLPLNELFVHGRNPLVFWQQIFSLCQEYFAIASRADSIETLDMKHMQECSSRLYQHKSLSRLKNFSKTQGIDLDTSVFYAGKNLGTLMAICEDCITRTLNLPCIPTVLHGDLCFSNMLFDTRARRLKILDPRGIDQQNNLTIFGNQSYDLAKLTHSVVGMYDFIIAGRYRLIEDPINQQIQFDIDKRLEAIQASFLATPLINGLATQDIIPAVVLLFLSMLPLHSDRADRQQAMLVNALRLYYEYVLNTDDRYIVNDKASTIDTHSINKVVEAKICL